MTYRRLPNDTSLLELYKTGKDDDYRGLRHSIDINTLSETDKTYLFDNSTQRTNFALGYVGQIKRNTKSVTLNDLFSEYDNCKDAYDFLLHNRTIMNHIANMTYASFEKEKKDKELYENQQKERASKEKLSKSRYETKKGIVWRYSVFDETYVCQSCGEIYYNREYHLASDFVVKLEQHKCQERVSDEQLQETFKWLPKNPNEYL